MAGVRLRHDSAKGVTFVVIHPTRTYQRPQGECPTCKIVHEKKAYHLKLDSEGTTIVSPEIFERLREAGLPHLTPENEVRVPPAQTVAVGTAPDDKLQILEHETTGGKIFVVKNKLFAKRKRKYADG